MKKVIFIIWAIILFFNVVDAASLLSASFNTSSLNDSRISASEIVRSSSALLEIVTEQATTCKYSQIQGRSYGNMDGSFDLSLETLHKKTLIGLNDGIYKYYIKCKDSSQTESKELEFIFSVSLPVKGQIVLADGSPVKEGKVEVKLITSKIVSQTPTLSYSLDGISYNPIPLFGSEATWTGYFIIPKLTEEKVGSFKFQGKDLEGITGEEITGGGVFLVDSIMPDSVEDIKAIGYEGKIELIWFYENDFKEFKIYRSTSPSVDKSDFYKQTPSKTLSDTSVEKGKTYYYKVSALDDANNEGDLSREVYATALLENTTISDSGLEARFFGVVDALLSDIDMVISAADSAKTNFEEKTTKEKEIYQDLKLEREIQSAKTELNSLREEISNYKTQRLDKIELDKKLNNAKLKISTIKKKIPENIIILEEKEEDKSFNEEDITKLIFELDPAIDSSLLNKKIKESLEISKDNFKVKLSGYNLEVSYIEGSRKKIALIKEIIDFSQNNYENLSIIEVIPKSIEESVSNIDIKNIDYDVLKEDPIVSFSPETKEIIYSLDKNIDLSLLKDIKTILLYDTEEESISPITGYFAFAGFENGKSYFGIILGTVIVAFLCGYLFFVRKNRTLSEKLIPLKKTILEAEEKVLKGKIGEAKAIYNLVGEHYKKLETKEKKLVYGEIENLHRKLNGN